MSNRNKTRIIFCLAVILLCIVTLNAGAQLAAGKSKFLGNVIGDGNNIPANFSTYWNQVTPENSGKWGSVESSRNSYNWSSLDKIYSYAKNQGFIFKDHTFVWGSQEPGWVSGLSGSEQKAEVEEWIRLSCERMPNMDMVDAVNEPLHAKPSYRNGIGGDGSTGWDWVIWSFETARKYTNAKLLINDYNILYSDSETSNYLTIINILKQRGLIDGIGVQCHSYESVATSTLRYNLDRLGNTGLPVYVSEWEARGDDQTQLRIYQEQFPMYWEHSAVQGITLWGYIQGTMWRNEGYLVTSASGGTERPALQWIRTYLQGTATSPPTVTNPPTQTNPPSNLGDVNNSGSIDIVDALLVAQYSVGLNPSNFNTGNADVTRDGQINIVDALRIAQCSVGLISCSF